MLNLILTLIITVSYKADLETMTHTVPNNYASAKVAISTLSKVHLLKNSNISFDRQLLKEFIIPFVIDVFHLSSE